MKSTLRSLAGAAAAALMLASASTAVSADTYRVAAVLPGSITDQAFNQQMYEGLKKAEKEHGVKIAYTEKTPQPDQVEAMSDYARRGYDMVIGAGGEFTAASKRVARQFPDTLVVCINCAPTEGVATVNYHNDQFGYVLGYVGGSMSNSGKAGMVAGQKISAFLELAEGFKKGFQDAKAGGEVSVVYTNDWDDVAKAKEATLNLISQGVDVVLPYLDNGIVGVVQAAQERDIWAAGAITDLSGQHPETNLISTVLDFGEATARAIELGKKGELAREDVKFALGSPAGHVASINGAVPAEVKKKVEAIVEQMQAGEFKL